MEQLKKVLNQYQGKTKQVSIRLVLVNRISISPLFKEVMKICLVRRKERNYILPENVHILQQSTYSDYFVQ